VADTHGVVRTNISVPRELKARMDAVKAPVNWSAVACRAFEAKLLELQSQQREVKAMEDVVARLKAADELERSEDYGAGYAAGERWAKEEARPSQLRSLRRSMDEPAHSQPPGFANVARDAELGVGPGVGWHVYFGTIGRKGPVTDWSEVKNLAAEADAFWSDVLGDDKHQIESASFGQGFVDGALSVWEKVKAKL
jgi:cell pole-organizing protein PopZ